jgi:hypothetical protein
MAASDAKETTMGQQQKDALKDIFRNAPLDIGGDPIEQRTNFEKMLSAQPLADDVTATPGELGGGPVLNIETGESSHDAVMLWFHGGWYVIGSPRTSAGLSSDLSRRVDAKVISADYRLAPQDPYPAAVQDARAAYRGLLDSGVDPGSIAIVGESAGGGLAVALLNVPPRKRHPDKSADRAQQWATVQPRLRTTLEGYIEQTRLSLRPATMVRVEAVLREFAVWLTADAPEVAAVRNLQRAHIERYKRHLAQRPSVRGGGRLSTIGLAEQLGTLRVCLERLSEWDGEDAPARVRMFAGDIPRRDQPLPRFIDDADEVEGVQGIDEKQLERVRADLSEYEQVGVGWADPRKERAEPLTLRPR